MAETNKISTCKYTMWNFLPKNILLQFSKLANLYFLLVLALQVIKPISMSAGKPNILVPLIVVIGISAVKDLLEDLKRRKADKLENESKVMRAVFSTSTFEEVLWQDLQVGDVV